MRCKSQRWAKQIGDSTSATLGKISPSDPSSEVLGLNNIGLAIGNSGLKGFAFDLTTNTMYNVNDFPKVNPLALPGITITNVTGINDYNQIVGTYKDAMGDSYGFTASFVAIPEPGTWAMLIGGALLVLRQRQRRIADRV